MNAADHQTSYQCPICRERSALIIDRPFGRCLVCDHIFDTDDVVEEVD